MTATTAPVVDYPTVTATIARLASSFADDFGTSLEETVDRIAQGMVDNASDARTRRGVWASESTSEQIEAALFYGSVARDVLDGSIARPSTGNVREHTLRLATS